MQWRICAEDSGRMEYNRENARKEIEREGEEHGRQKRIEDEKRFWFLQEVLSVWQYL